MDATTVSAVQAGVKGVVKAAITRANGPIGGARLRRALGRKPTPLRLELGSNTPRSGWVVTNYSWRTRYLLDATSPWPVDDGSVDLIFADNMIEHVTLDSARAVLLQAHRALRPGGTIRLATPDVEAIARLYLGEDEESAAAVLARHRRNGLVAEHQVDLIRVPFAEHGHHLGYLYDEESLSAELKRAGFHDVRRRATGESTHPDLRGLEGRTDAEAFVQLVVEADA